MLMQKRVDNKGDVAVESSLASMNNYDTKYR
jgi:hypothetical protein